MNKTVKNYILYLIYELIALLAPLITAPYLTRTLGASNYGVYSYINASISLISTISLVGLYSYGCRQTAYDLSDEEKVSSMFWELMLLRLFCGLAGTIMIVVYAIASGYFLFFLLFFPFYLANVLDCSWFFVGAENMGPCVLKNTLSKLAMVLGIFLFVKSVDDVGIYLLVVAIPTLVANLSLYPLIKKYVKRPKIKAKQLLLHLKQSFALCLPQLVTQLYLQVDKVMLEWLTGEASQVSFYDQAEKIALIPLSIITCLSAVIMPKIASDFKHGDKEQTQAYLVMAGKYSMFMAFPMMFGMMAVSRWFIPWYLGAEYMPSIYVLIIISPMIVLNSLSGISGNQYFVATNQTKILLISSVIAAGANMVLNAILIPFYGCYGAAVATVAANLLLVIVQYIVFCKQLKMKEVFTSSIKYALASLFMFICIMLISIGLELSIAPMTTALQVCLGFVLYLILMIIFREELVFMSLEKIKIFWKKRKK